MSKKIFLIMLLLVFVSGCDGISGGGGAIKIDYGRVYSGTKGVDISFLNNAPQSDLYSNYDFNIGVNIANQGAKDTGVCFKFVVERDYIKVEGGGPVFIDNLEGKSAYNLEGTFTDKFFEAKTGEPVKLVKPHSSPISVEYYYDYSTSAQMDVCIDPDAHGKIPKKPCAVRDFSLSSQGGPVAVKSVNVNMIPISGNSVIPSFEIKIQNVGNGRVVRNGESDDLCRGNIRENIFNLVNVDVTLSNNKINCNRNVIKLKNGVANVVCKGPAVNIGEGTYTAPLIIKLDYGYFSSVTKKVNILSEEIYT